MRLAWYRSQTTMGNTESGPVRPMDAAAAATSTHEVKVGGMKLDGAPVPNPNPAIEADDKRYNTNGSPSPKAPEWCQNLSTTATIPATLGCIPQARFLA